MAEFDVLVVGGGLAGLAAALELQAQGRRVLIVEHEPALGGKAGTISTAFGDFPSGPTSFNGRYPAFWRLLTLLGIEEKAEPLAPTSQARLIVRDHALESIRPSPLSVLTTGALTLADKFSLARDYFSTRKAPAAGEDESLDAFLERRFGRALTDHFFGAVMTGIFAGDLKKLSAATCMPALVNAEKEYGSVLRGALAALKHTEDGARLGLYTFREGFGVIGQAAATKLTAWTQADVVSLRPAQGRVHAVVRRGAAETVIEVPEVVLATEAVVAAQLVAPWNAAAGAVLAGFEYAPIALVHWAERTPGESSLPLGFGYLVAPIEQTFALGTLFVSDLLGQTPRRFSTFVGGALAPERATLSDEQLREGVQADLTLLCGGVLGQLAAVTRWPRAVFQPAPGHLAQLERLKQVMAGAPVVLAGSYFGGAAMKDAVMSGFLAAHTLLDRAVQRKLAPSLEVRA